MWAARGRTWTSCVRRIRLQLDCPCLHHVRRCLRQPFPVFLRSCLNHRRALRSCTRGLCACVSACAMGCPSVATTPIQSRSTMPRPSAAARWWSHRTISTSRRSAGSPALTSGTVSTPTTPTNCPSVRTGSGSKANPGPRERSQASPGAVIYSSLRERRCHHGSLAAPAT